MINEYFSFFLGIKYLQIHPMMILMFDDLFHCPLSVVKCNNHSNVEHDKLIGLIEMNVYDVYVI